MRKDREEMCELALVPQELASEVRGYSWARNRVGQAGASVYRLYGKPGAPDLYLKHGHGDLAAGVREEAAKMRWLADYIAAPAVMRCVHDPADTWVLMTAMPGKTAQQVLEEDPESRAVIVDTLADFLKSIHSVPISVCPFKSPLNDRLELARKRIDAGLVDEGDFDDEREGWGAERVWDAIHTRLPFTSDPVVTHGDYSLDNLLMEAGAVVGCVDVGRLGIADRYQDLAIMWNCLGDFDVSLQRRFLSRYGVSKPDEGKLQLYLMLDELF
ncbi:MAG: APH(3')-I family aminoglycoside O-phosphotransferase [Pseudomonadota bacterium]